MIGASPAPADPSALFAERLLRIIDEGRRIGSYKLALLLALLDASAAESTPSGAAPEVLQTRVIASHVLRLYLPQVATFVGRDAGAATLRQITARRSPVLDAISALNDQARHMGCRSVAEMAGRLPEAFERTLDVIELTFARYPLRLLQVVGGQDLPFLYDIDWGEGVSLRRLHADGGGLVRFHPGAADALVRLGPLMRPLVETHWTRMVATLNGIDLEEERLRAHLFGASRRSFPRKLRARLGDLHDGRCFYCAGPLGSSWDLDHVIPWSRHPNDAIENLVPADRRCNTAKSDSLPAVGHVARWRNGHVARAEDLAGLADSTGWLSDLEHTLAVVRSTYRYLPVGTPLWKSVGSVEAYQGRSPSIPGHG